MELKPGESATIKRVYNNNVLLAGLPDGSEMVLVGKGIGFNHRQGETVDVEAADQRFVPDGSFAASHGAGVLGDAPLEQIEVAREIMAMVQAELRLEPRLSLLVPILDHMGFAVQRAREGIKVDFPLRWEVAQLYPAEGNLGRRVVALIKEQLGVQLQDEEWVAFALHFVNQQWSTSDFSKTVSMTETIAKVFTLLSVRWQSNIDENAHSAARFVTHLRFLFARSAKATTSAVLGVDVFESVRQAYPEAAEAALEVAELIGEALNRHLGADEVSYLALHTSRLYVEMLKTENSP
ncbi:MULTISPECIES: PRD domain-containing protein [Arthrobacter]|uniref:Transcriptional antiterminator n=1 Tax=Arthrobacter psychrochitiniphilus TaxID=291045 RepID=A0A2V3DTW0_9MICC|nr:MULTISPECIES: PRD domain-containing protein [Arthrobacter]NYG18597.1 beta-glucoside operon transcriptional antiterminator [Arthrobacter psychrochitiniphilus]PXA66450.1 transcriptional antiterminator [Arthrobacter psychrochitiniphilus]